jgi:hypothetical protein
MPKGPRGEKRPADVDVVALIDARSEKVTGDRLVG